MLNLDAIVGGEITEKNCRHLPKDCIPKCEVDFTKSQNSGVLKTRDLQFKNQRLSFLPLVVIWHHFIKCWLILKVLHFVGFPPNNEKTH